MRRRTSTRAACLLQLLCALAALAQQPQLDSAGQIDHEGRPTPYLIRRLPVSSVPDLPAPLQAELTHRGCLIPQTWQAHHPENVVRAALSAPGSDDWAILCSVNGQVSLLVAISGDPASLIALATFAESNRLRPRDASGALGFDWGIDPASPAQVHQAQTGLSPRPAPIDHDALADTLMDRRTIYHYFTRNAWTRLETPE